jgi:hypothetical protein
LAESSARQWRSLNGDCSLALTSWYIALLCRAYAVVESVCGLFISLLPLHLMLGKESGATDLLDCYWFDVPRSSQGRSRAATRIETCVLQLSLHLNDEQSVGKDAGESPSCRSVFGTAHS